MCVPVCASVCARVCVRVACAMRASVANSIINYAKGNTFNLDVFQESQVTLSLFLYTPSQLATPPCAPFVQASQLEGNLHFIIHVLVS